MAADFDAARYRVATDALVEAGFDDVAAWVRERIADRERPGAMAAFAGMPLSEPAETLSRVARLLYRYCPRSTDDTDRGDIIIRAPEVAALLARWLGNQVAAEAFAAGPLSRPDEDGAWRFIAILPEHRDRGSIVMICPICRVAGPLPDPGSPTMRDRRVRTFVMQGVRIGFPEADLPQLYVGRCSGRGRGFAG